jgi:hypothetical protein
MPDLRAEVALWPVASRLGSPLIWYTSDDGPGASAISHTPGAALSWK